MNRLRSRKIVHIGRPRYAYYHVRVFYNGGIIDWLEDGLFKAAGDGRLFRSHSSGCCMFRPYKRDHEWDFVKVEDARSCYKRIVRFLFGKHNHPLPTRSVELWDERPRMLTARAVIGPFKRVPGGAPELRRKRKVA